jgi:hypothetical protein
MHPKKREIFTFLVEYMKAPLLNKTKFAQNFERGIQTALKLIEEHPIFADGFQVMLDTPNGMVYHFDFDQLYQIKMRT